jgi:predicted RNase H-like nuclease (RuvC/YqgF family)
MEWYNILSIVVGALGGTAGFVGLYKAKSEKTTIDVGNMQTMLDEAHKMYDEMKEEKDGVNQEFHAYKEETMSYIEQFKERFTKVEQRLDRAEETVFQLKGAIYRGYRCKFPENIADCPVIKEYEKLHCDGCDTCENIK